MQDADLYKKLENEIRLTIKKAYASSNKAMYQSSSGRRLFLNEVLAEGVQDGSVVGALNIVYAAGSFMSLDRVVYNNSKFRKQRRIIYYLDSRPGQIGSTLLLELLKIPDGDKFSKHLFVQRIDEDYFQSESINISSGEINESLSRMFRKTLNQFFGVHGRQFVRNNFVLKMNRMNVAALNQKITYGNYKREIDSQTNQFIRDLNKKAIA